MSDISLVSIVTPCLNSERFVKRCIESVLAQDHPHVEYVVQDGGSTDGTLDILRSYEGKVDWVSEKDSGEADGLNRALRRCKGSIILVLNADDMLLPHAARWAVEKMDDYPEAAVIYGDEYIIDEEDRVIEEFTGPDPYDFAQILCVERVIPAQAAFIRRAHLEAVGLYTEPALKRCPDYEIFIRIGVRFPMRYVSGFVSKYRWHVFSFSRDASQVKFQVTSKRAVIDRVLRDPRTPPEIRALYGRACGGLHLWACEQLRHQGALVAAWRHNFYARRYLPDSERLETVTNCLIAASRKRVFKALGA